MFDPLFDITKPPPPVDNTFPHVTLLEQLRQSDELLVQQFLSSRAPKPSLRDKTTTRSSPAAIGTYRTELREALLALDGLKHCKRELEHQYDTSAASDARWSEEIERTEQVKTVVEEKLRALEDGVRLSALTHKLAVRKKKRAWQRRRNVRLRQAREAQQEERTRQAEEIVRWESEWKARLEAERVAREELQTKSLVLADVRRRKARAKRYLSRFEKTIHLHEQRQNAPKNDQATAEGRCAEADSATEAYRKKVNVLVGEWKSKLAECMREEKLLKNELARRSTNNEGRRRENRWRKALFGDATALMNGRRGRGAADVHELIRTRWSWDAYALPPLIHAGGSMGEEDVSSSGGKGYPVPTGWVFPPENPAPDWAIYREPTKSKPEKNVGEATEAEGEEPQQLS